MPTYRLLIEYEGTSFHGWQIQPGHATIQEALEDALAVVLRERVDVVGSGRTDAGVHARGQVAHFSTERPVDTYRLLRSLNGLLPGQIAILAVDAAPEGFHARYSARARRYHYHVSTAPRALDRYYRCLLLPEPDFTRMNEAAAALLGTHDFDAFCRARSETTNRVCTVTRAAWVAEERPGDWRFEIVADRFLHGMVRAVVGTLVQIGQSKRPVDDVARIFASADRREAGPAAPPHGLVLEHVSYDEVSPG
ncbi:MAG TPA: tRNA pseudouridine(38-40) synthase TruA [Rhodothermales bacterium]|nr:tRNA pseudouridine(38-40) synthase TruA [Rhodothermales bacterium]